jgi:hypothetical protein
MSDRNADLERHTKNREDLVSKREELLAHWKAEDEARDAQRQKHLAAFDRGLEDIDAVIGQTRSDLGIVAPVEPAPVEPTVEEHSEEHHEGDGA